MQDHARSHRVVRQLGHEKKYLVSQARPHQFLAAGPFFIQLSGCGNLIIVLPLSASYLQEHV